MADFNAARAEQEKLVLARPNDAGALCVLGLIDAALGRKDEALAKAGAQLSYFPWKRMRSMARASSWSLARIAAWVGDKNLACEQLDRSTRLPGGPVTYGDLKLMPWWDPLRGDPCFEKIVASLAPK